NQKKQSLRHGKPCHLPLHKRRLKDSCHICGSGATSASGGSFDEPIGFVQATSTAGGHDSEKLRRASWRYAKEKHRKNRMKN
ncbi:MAG: hypothetical protein IKB34_05380, partial [Clostridia bacterium]|nr:hypothetical protein [Clostridia bacterium]